MNAHAGVAPLTSSAPPTYKPLMHSAPPTDKAANKHTLRSELAEFPTLGSRHSSSAAVWATGDLSPTDPSQYLAVGGDFAAISRAFRRSVPVSGTDAVDASRTHKAAGIVRPR